MRKTIPGLVFSVLLLFGCGSEPTPEGIISNLIDAEVSYEYAREMLLDSIHRYEFVLSKNMAFEAIEALAPTLEKSETVKRDAVKVGDYISAQLIDPSQGENFDIVPLSLKEQGILVADSFACLWQWDIRPLQKGTLPLRLKVLTRIGDREVDIPVFDANIEVYTREAEGFPLVYGGIALGILGLLGYLFFRKKKSAEKRSHLPKALALNIKKLVGDGKTVDALELLEVHLEKTKSKHLNDAIVLQSTLQDAMRKNNLNVLSAEDFRQEAAKVNFALLDLVKQLED